MIEQFERELTEAERRLLRESATFSESLVRLGNTVKWSVVWLLSFVCCGLLLFFLAPLVEIGSMIMGLLFGLVLVAAVFCLCAIALLWSGYFHWSSVERQFQHSVVPEIGLALDDGRVRVKKVSASAVVELVEYEDEGQGYIFQIEDSQSLFLKGQHIFPVDEEMLWPNSEFEIVRTIVGDRWVGLFCYGKLLTPIRTIELADCKENAWMLSCEEVIEEELDSFASSLLVESNTG